MCQPPSRRTFATHRTPAARAPGGKPAKPAGDKVKPARGKAGAHKTSEVGAGEAQRNNAVGAPAESWVEDDHWPRLSEPHTVSVIGAPMQYGQGLDGADMAPEAFRDKGAWMGCAWRVVWPVRRVQQALLSAAACELTALRCAAAAQAC